MRVTDQYFWNIIFIAFFLALLVSGVIILEGSPENALHELTPFEFILLALATFRLTRLMVYDKITAFFREQFYDAKVTKTLVILEKPKHGPRRTLVELLSCPWCIGMWAGATVVFFYELTPYAWYPIVMLAVAAVGTLMQLFSNMIGWKAEELKKKSEEASTK
jgi:hypothetical protein